MNIISTSLILDITLRLVNTLINSQLSHNVRHARLVSLLDMFGWLQERRRDRSETIFDELGMMLTYVLTMDGTHQEVKETLRLIALTIAVLRRGYPSIPDAARSLDEIPF